VADKFYSLVIDACLDYKLAIHTKMKLPFIFAFAKCILAFHASASLDGRSPFGPEVANKFLKFDHLVTLREDLDNESDWLAAFLLSNFDLAVDRDYQITDSYTSQSNQVKHVYLRQIVNGIPVANAVMNINVLHNTIVSLGSSFVQTGEEAKLVSLSKIERPVSSNPILSPTDAFSKFAESIGVEVKEHDLSMRASLIDSSFLVTNTGISSDVPTALNYIQSNGELILTWALEVDINSNWFNAHVDTETGKVVSLNDWVSHASYNVYPLGTNDPIAGPRNVVTNPDVKAASPNGWHTDSKSSYTSTRGNNVAAQENQGIYPHS